LSETGVLTKQKLTYMTEKQQEIKRIFAIKDKTERIKAIQEYMANNIQPSTRSKANVYADALVIFDGKLF